MMEKVISFTKPFRTNKKLEEINIRVNNHTGLSLDCTLHMMGNQLTVDITETPNDETPAPINAPK